MEILNFSCYDTAFYVFQDIRVLVEVVDSVTSDTGGLNGWEEDDELRTPTVEEQNFPDSKVPLRSSSEHSCDLCFGNMSHGEGL